MKAIFFILLLPWAVLAAAPVPLMVVPGELLVVWEFSADEDADSKQLKLRKETVSAVSDGALHVMPPSLVKQGEGKETKWGDSDFARAGLVGLPQDYVAWARWKYLRPTDADALAKGLVYIDLGHRMIRVTLTREGAVLLLENHLMGREEKKPAIVLQEVPELKLIPDHWYDILVEVKGDEVVVQIDDQVLYGKHDLIAKERYDTFNFDATGDGYLLNRIEIRAAGDYRGDWADWVERKGKVLFNHE